MHVECTNGTADEHFVERDEQLIVDRYLGEV